MKDKKEIMIPDEVLISKIYLIRGQKVMLDVDLAKLYGVQTGRLNEQVKRNKERFPDDFMFELTKEESKNLLSQNAIASWGGRRNLPKVFTEHGVLMLSSVLKSKKAITVNIQIMRIFVKLRTMLYTNKELVVKMNQIEEQLIDHGDDIHTLFEYVDKLMEDKEIAAQQTDRKKIGFKKIQ